MRSVWMAVLTAFVTCSTAAVALPEVVDEGELAQATSTLLDRVDAGRVALVVNDADDVRRTALERSLVRVVRERRREDVVSPTLVRARLGAVEQAQLTQRAREPAGLAADHLLFVEVLAVDGAAQAKVRLVDAATGAVIGTQQVAVAGSTTSTTAQATDLQRAAEDTADACADAVEAQGLDLAAWSVAVPPATSTGAAKSAQLDRQVAAELTRALRDRGFLVVERRQLDAALQQLALGQLAGDDDAAALGKVVGAQGLVLAQVAEAGASFEVTARLVDVASAKVLTATTTTVDRDGVVGLSAVETHTPFDSAMHSLLVPGWGQVDNGEPGKAALFAIGSYGMLATTLGLGSAAFLGARAYDAVSTDDLTPAAAAAKTVALREQTNTLLAATAVAGGVTVVVWAFNVVDALGNAD